MNTAEDSAYLNLIEPVAQIGKFEIVQRKIANRSAYANTG